MVVNITNAISAYKNAPSLNNNAGESGSGFADLLKDAIGNSVDSMRRSENVQKEAIAGNAGTLELTEAINAASIQIETLKLFHDKMLAAHDTIMKSPI